MIDYTYTDWGEASENFDDIKSTLANRDITSANEAQTRFDVIDRVVREVLGWKHGQVTVEEKNEGEKQGFIDYTLRSGDATIIIEAKKAGSSFPSPTKKPKLKLSGNVLGTGEIAKAISQAEEYAKTKRADAVIVTNGLCWCFFSTHERDENSYANLLFPFSTPGHAEELFNFFSVIRVENGSLTKITNRLPAPEDRLISAFPSADGRIDRNNIADHIIPALDNALYADALLSNIDALEKCFVQTEARTKFDGMLGMYLTDPKPEIIKPAKRVRKNKADDHIQEIVRSSVSSYAPPVTLLIGPVGAGKSTYLRHFELISGVKLLNKQKVHWIYIDFEEMGQSGSPREFLYHSLRTYLLGDNTAIPTDYKNAIEPAYAEEIAALARGPYALIYSNKEKFNEKITDYIQQDFQRVEPFVDKVFKHITKEHLCIIVLDNIDLYEDEKLETAVFSEGLALSKRILCNVFVSVRDTTFVRHRSDATFDAYELRKLWLDPPPFKQVLSARLSYAKKILAGRSARISFANNLSLSVPDLSDFFEIVQQSILRGQAGDYVEAMADLNIRRGLSLITNFLTSGHIQADRAIESYINGDTRYIFPFHEIFKGTMLGQWRHFRESRADCINLFDSRLGAKKLRLLRLSLLNFIVLRAQDENSVEVPIKDCIEIFSRTSASEFQIIETIEFINRKGLVRNVSSEEVRGSSTIVATRSGGYYTKFLTRKFVYVEECMFDTAIEEQDVWRELSEYTSAIEGYTSVATRMELRQERITTFLNYICQLEEEMLAPLGNVEKFALMPLIRSSVLEDVKDAVNKARRRY